MILTIKTESGITATSKTTQEEYTWKRILFLGIPVYTSRLDFYFKGLDDEETEPKKITGFQR